MAMPQVCVEKQLADTEFLKDGISRIALLKSKKWPNGSQIHYAFRGGNEGQRKKVQETLEEVMKFVNLDFKLKGAGTTVAELRITFDPNGGAWSYIGTDAARQPKGEPTMNLGFGYNDGQDGTYRHEVGHFLGAIHEHQNPLGGIQWNREQVIRDLSGPPNNWDSQTIEHNMFAKYSVDQLNATQFDAKSIMLYAIPRSWTTNGFSSSANATFSQKDIDWLMSQYPGRGGGGGGGGTDPSKAIELVVLKSYHDEISSPGERDLFRFDVDSAGKHYIEATGGLPLVLRLFGPNSETNLVQEANNIAMKFNPQMAVSLNAGRYYLQVYHSDVSARGKYGVRVLRLDEADTLAQLSGEMLIKVVCPALPGTYTTSKQV